MPPIARVGGRNNVQQTISGTTDWQDAYTQAAATWLVGGNAVGGTYALIVTAQGNISNVNRHFGIRVTHGGVVFPGSSMSMEPGSAVDARKNTYVFMVPDYVVPGPGGEDVVVQFRTEDAAGPIARIDSVQLRAMRLDVDLPGHFTEATLDDTAAPVLHTFVFADRALITFTPPTPGNYLIFFNCSIIVNTAAESYEVRLRRDGTEAAPAEAAPLYRMEGEDGDEEHSGGFFRVFTLDDTPHTFAVQSRDDDASGPFNQHNLSSIIAVRLTGVFEQHVFDWNGAAFTPSVADAYEEMVGVSVTPITAGPWWIFGAARHNATGGTYAGIRTQVDGITVPTGFDDSTNCWNRDVDDEPPMCTIDEQDFAASLRDIDFDGLSSVPSPIENRSVLALALELLGGAPPVTPVGRTKGVTRRRQTALVAAQRDDADGNPTEEYLLLRTDEFGQVRTVP